MFLQQAGDFMLAKILRQPTVIKEITCRKNKLLIINDSSGQPNAFRDAFPVCMIRMIAFGVG